ncbi:hypothetical protein [Robertmurraya sp.]|uniref:hypothetical protein n=1 Tax=Robertmurraya sp. TaxID=2837525 RepID=UPI0037044AB3
MNTALKILAIIAIVVLAIVAIGLLAVYWAWALSILWGWFLVPLGVKSIGVAHAYGFTCITGLILGTRGLNTNKTEDKDAWKSQIVVYLLSPILALGFGYIALGFM